MNRISSITFLAALAASGVVAGAPAYTTPVGYTTETIKAGLYNVFGVTLQNPVIISGNFEAVAGKILTDTGSGFGGQLVAGQTYILEITSGGLSGAIQEITSFSGDTITTPQDLSASLSVGTTYKLRKAKTIGEIFGNANEAGLLTGSATTADILWVPDGAGFQKYYYTNASPPFVTAGWKNTATGNTNQSSAPIVYTDGLMLQRRGATDLNLVISGELKVTNTIVAIDQPYTYVGGVYPSGVTLANSGLSSSLAHGSITTADVIWVPNGAGAFFKYYYANAAPPFTTAGWKRSDTGNTDQSTAALTSAFYIEKRTVNPFNATIAAPFTNP